MPRVERPLITCEHGGNMIPREWRHLFRSDARRLATHRGYDAGALELARLLARRLDAPLISATTSRLLVDLNRSLTNPAVFSDRTRPLSAEQRRRILDEHYHPYRCGVEETVAQLIAPRDDDPAGTVIHISVHSFTPVLAGAVRNADIGLLYDPSRPRERGLCDRWRGALADLAPGLRVRRNYPYRGVADGLVTHLRGCFLPTRYVGVELEINQRLVRGRRWAAVQDAVAQGLARALESGRPPRSHSGRASARA